MLFISFFFKSFLQCNSVAIFSELVGLITATTCENASTRSASPSAECLSLRIAGCKGFAFCKNHDGCWIGGGKYHLSVSMAGNDNIVPNGFKRFLNRKIVERTFSLFWLKSVANIFFPFFYPDYHFMPKNLEKCHVNWGRWNHDTFTSSTFTPDLNACVDSERYRFLPNS